MPELQVRDLKVWYGAAQALFDVSLTVGAGLVVGAAGSAGAVGSVGAGAFAAAWARSISRTARASCTAT